MKQKLENSGITKMKRLKFILILQSVTFALVNSKINNYIQNEKVINGNKFLKTDKNTLFGKSPVEVENSVKSFILTLTVPLEKRLLEDFRKVSFKNNFKKAITTTTEVVVENIRAFRKKLSGINLNDIRVTISDRNNTVKSNLLQNGLIVATEFIDFVNIGRKFLFGNQHSGANNFFKSNVSPKLQIMDFFIFTSEFFTYVDCATNDTNVKKSLKYLSSHSSTTVMEYLKKNLKTPPKNRAFNATETICYSLENIIPGGYNKCISDLNNVYSCIQYQIPLQSSQNGTKSYQILQNGKKLFSKKWISSVRILEPRCKIEEKRFKCNINKKNFRSTESQVKYIIENYVGNELKSGSSLSKIANRFSRVVSKNPVSKSIVRNFFDYITIWRAGQKKRNMLLKMSKKNPWFLKKFKKVTKSFYNYKNGVIEQLLNAIVAFNQIPAYLEKSLEKAFSKQKQTLFGSLMIYLSRLIKAIFDRDNQSSIFKPSRIDYNKNSNGLVEIQEDFPYFHPRMSIEDIFDNMLRTMNHIRNQNLSRNKSAFNGGLTNILLALMFLETLSAVTFLISQNINISHVNESFPVENEEIPEIDPNEDDNDENEDASVDDQEDVNDDEEEEEDEKETESDLQFTKRERRFLHYPDPNYFEF